MLRRARPVPFLALLFAASGGLAACGSDDTQSPGPGSGGAYPATGGAGGLSPSGGGALTGGATASGGLTGSGGTMAATGGAPVAGATLGECFAPVPSAPQSCRGYCEGRGKTCVQKGCAADGTPVQAGTGFTWLTFDAASCPGATVPQLSSFDPCASPIELSVQIPEGQVVRCCCSS